MKRYNDRYDDFDDDMPRGGNRREPQRFASDDDDYYRPQPDRGRQHDTGWADDLASRRAGEWTGSDDRYPSERNAGKRRAKPMRNDSDPYGNNNTPNSGGSFRKRHPVLMNLLYMLLTGILLMWILLWFLDFWTFHGEERVVPDVKGQPYATASENASLSGMRAEITDSVFDTHSQPGTVVDQTPVAGAKIKRGGTVYLTVVAFSPKLVTVPDFYNVSARQARSMFEGLGIKDIREVPVVSEYAGLVLGAKFNGVSLQPGARIPVSAVITLEVGSGTSDNYDDEESDIDSESIDEMIEELDIE